MKRIGYLDMIEDRKYIRSEKVLEKIDFCLIAMLAQGKIKPSQYRAAYK